MLVNDLFPSSYLKKEDVPFPTSVTIKQVSQEEISGDGGKEMKAVIAFVGNLKPMILNKGNAVTIAEAYGDDTSAWSGKTVEIYTDSSVMFAGKRVGGLRIRIPQGANRAPSSNGHADPGAVSRWDLSDGQNVMANQTTAQVLAFFAGGADPKRFRAKPVGAPKEQAKTADQWGFVNGQTVEADDKIPF